MPDTMMAETPMDTHRQSAEIKDLAAALVKAQAEIEGAKKDSKATVTGTTTRTYADLASVWDAIREPLTKNGLAVVQFPRTSGNGAEIKTTLLHGPTGQYMSDVLWVPCGKNDAQGLGSAITYGRRYALMAVVGVCPIDDDGAAAAAGMAGGGTDFRPAGRRPVGMRQFEGEAQQDGLIDTSRPKGTLPNGNGKKTAAEKAKTWVDNAIATIKLGGQTVNSLSRFLSENNDKIEWLEANAAAEHDRFFAAYNEAADAARAKVAA